MATLAAPVSAAPPQVQLPSADQFDTTPTAPGPFGFLNNIERSNYLLGDMWGLRPWLSQYGISLGLTETSEVLGNTTGGVKRGFDYDGLTQAVLQVDSKRAFGYYGGTLNVSALQIHGQNLSANNLDTLQTSSGIEADRATRLWELWYDQKFLEEDRLDMKIGQQSLDQEFMVSQNALVFVNTMFGWPMVPSADLPGGGPAYPLSALGLRLRGKPTDSITVLAGVFNGSPTRGSNGDPQVLNPSGTSFPLNGGTLAIAEVQYAYPSLGTMLYADQSEPLGGTYRLGVWYNSESFADQRYDTLGRSLAAPDSTGVAQLHRGNFSVYGVADQILWVDATEPDRNVSGFIRAMGTPQADRNLIDFSLNLGLVMHEPFPHRDDDTFGIGMGYAHVSKSAAALDHDTALFSGLFTPVRSGETFVEITYSYQAAPWLQIQPDIQYIFNPGGGLADASGTAKIKNELVLGVRTNIQF